MKQEYSSWKDLYESKSEEYKSWLKSQILEYSDSLISDPNKSWSKEDGNFIFKSDNTFLGYKPNSDEGENELNMYFRGFGDDGIIQIYMTVDELLSLTETDPLFMVLAQDILQDSGIDDILDGRIFHSETYLNLPQRSTDPIHKVSFRSRFTTRNKIEDLEDLLDLIVNLGNINLREVLKYSNNNNSTGNTRSLNDDNIILGRIDQSDK